MGVADWYTHGSTHDGLRMLHVHMDMRLVCRCGSAPAKKWRVRVIAQDATAMRLAQKWMHTYEHFRIGPWPRIYRPLLLRAASPVERPLDAECPIADTARTASMPDPDSGKSYWREMFSQFAAGAFSGFAITVLFNPLDVIKTRIQVQSKRPEPGAPRTTMQVIAHLYRTEGGAGFYKGLNASLWALVPTWAVYWFSYERFKSTLGPNLGVESVHVNNMLAAVGAGTVTTFMTSPFWIVKTRMQVELALGENREYPTLFKSLRKIVSEESVWALYRGLVPSLLGLLHVGIQFPVYEEMKRWLAIQNPDSHFLNVMAASSCSKVIATVIAYPHEVLRSRLQASSSPMKGIRSDFSRMLVICKDIYCMFGPSGFYNGLFANLIRTIPATCLTFCTYEFARKYLAIP
ncbi:Mitochondrial nicotinamide adenine dinucleotide transporter 1 [Porphyridium purpureum]|uniref:Mitochondrial nicotinamide adenine dinucleotide transporter 1 n=1 Tax=Porphyridium purpureum TaxID=35688 RepID=A0A5J4YMM8_PORPP|nr:Mitochondrial nicotinamide adenine dinucleotide transporter 1 [Porphyridium purpureum]|eukprot:POR1163..scf222_8